MRLPQEFENKMKPLLQESWPSLLEAWKKPPYQGLRVNNIKVKKEEFLRKTPFSLKPVPWAEDGFYYEEYERPGKHEYFLAGLYYLQEPSAMAAAVSLGVKPGDRVLDLCAAPGGKSTQLASCLQGQGLLVSNDISRQRLKPLIWNLERCGVTNAIITNETPSRLAGRFHGFFDKILVDAPCSGEGMFHRDQGAVRSWEKYGPDSYLPVQEDILHWASKMLKPGGRILYSTCTFSPEENEGIIASFMDNHQDFRLLPLAEEYGWEKGRPEWLGLPNSLKCTRRLWPYKVKGEGHFLALMEKNSDRDSVCKDQISTLRNISEMVENKTFWNFMEENLNLSDLNLFLKGETIYSVPASLPCLDGLKIVRPGWMLGSICNNRFQPAQALAMGIRPIDAKRVLRFQLKDEGLKRYLKGETILETGEKGWTLVCLEDYPLGWGKQTGEMLKNYYPPLWRIMD